MNGPFGNGFPYTNFHELNMDWIIRIAKDFLDQYTHIQDIISSGETSLQNTTAAGIEALQAEKTRLEGLLDAWYTEHSEDIAGELTQAITDFQTAAAAYGAEVIASIPEDYTALSNTVNNTINELSTITGTKELYDWVYQKRCATNGSEIGEPTGSMTYDYMEVTGCSEGDIFTITAKSTTASYRLYAWVATNGTIVETLTGDATYINKEIVCPNGATRLFINARNDDAAGHHVFKGR